MAINEQKYENVILYLIANMRDGMILRLSSVTSFFALYAICPYYEYG